MYVDFKNGRADGEYSEFCELVKSTGLEIVSTIKATRLRADARLFIGSGKAEEIRVTAEKYDADVVIFNRL